MSFYTPEQHKRTYPAWCPSKGPLSKSRRSQVKRNRAMYWTMYKRADRHNFRDDQHMLFTLRTNWRLLLVMPGWYHLGYKDPSHSYSTWNIERYSRLRRIIAICRDHNLDEKLAYYVALLNEHTYHTL